jgi:hypothetical protein
MSPSWRAAALTAALLTAPTAVHAQGPLSPAWMTAGRPVAGVATVDGCQQATGFETLFQPGATSTQVLAGAYFSIALGPRSRAFNYVPVSVRQGVMLTAPEDHWWGHGNYECLFDLTFASITSKYGSWFAGPSFFLRANWVEPDCPVVPYIQIGTGAVLNDAHEDQSQHAIGQILEFYQHLEVGAKWFVTPDLSLDIEGGIQHLSNGGLARRNYGVNMLGVAIGFTYYFPAGR